MSMQRSSCCIDVLPDGIVRIVEHGLALPGSNGLAPPCYRNDVCELHTQSAPRSNCVGPKPFKVPSSSSCEFTPAGWILVLRSPESIGAVEEIRSAHRISARLIASFKAFSQLSGLTLFSLAFCTSSFNM